MYDTLLNYLSSCNDNEFVRMEDVCKLCEEDVHKPRQQRRTEDQIVEVIFGENPDSLDSKYACELAGRRIRELQFRNWYKPVVRDVMLMSRANYVRNKRIDASTKHVSLAEASTCPICFDDCPAGTSFLALRRCRHSFHVLCVWPWLMNNNSCPCCRQPVLLQ